MSREKGNSLSRLLLILGAYKENNPPRFPQQEAGAGFILWIINKLIPSYASSVSDRDLLISHSIFASGS